MSPLISHALTNLRLAGVEEGSPLHADVMELMEVFASQDHSRTPTFMVANLFQRLAKSENLPVKEFTHHDVSMEGRKAWEKHVVSCFPREEFYKFSESVRSQTSMWRLASYEDFLSDVLHCGGLEAATLLSMLFRPKVVVEMGLHGGFTTLALCKLNPTARVYGVDCNSKMADADLPIGYAAWMGNVKNLTVSVMNSWELDLKGKVDLCFIDADHCGDAPLKDSMRAWENRNQNGDWCIAWDDYHPNNPDVKFAVDQFVSEVAQMPLHATNSWVWIGTRSPGEMKKFLEV